MFYICGIYDEALEKHFEHMSFSWTNRERDIRGAYGTYHYQVASRVKVGVFDSTDKNIEWWSVPDFLAKIQQVGVEVEGFKYAFFADSIRAKTISLTNYNSMKYATFHKVIVGTDAGVSDLSRAKMLGMDVGFDGTLKSFHKSMVQGNALVVPEYINSLSSTALNGERMYGVKVLRFHEGMKYDWGTTDVVQNAKKKILPDMEYLEVEGDFTMSIRLFQDIKVNVNATGQMRVGNFRKFLEGVKEKEAGKWGYNWRGMPKDAKFWFSGGNGVWHLNFGDFSFRKVR